MEPRTDDDIAEQYRVEVDLSNRLKRAPAAERARLYTEVYEELFRSVPNHPQLVRKSAGSTENVSWQLGLLSRYLDRDTCLLEIGAGDLSFSVAVAPRTKKVVAVDVSAIISERDDLPPNVERRICDGMSLPVEAGTVDVAYSNQLIEHLHPDDAQEHVDNVFKALRPNGIYVCVTPNRLGGPWDISGNFVRVAAGLHIREYTGAELVSLFHNAGFAKFRFHVGASGRYFALPLALVDVLESLLSRVPYAVARRLCRSPLRGLLGVKLAARKPV
jgi:SAM-dependent methyltransferase